MSKIKYKIAQHKKFVKDMGKLGILTELYHGRYFWHGPAVRVRNLQDALSGTKVPCQWDNMGLEWIVYPKANDPSLKDVQEELDSVENEDNERWEIDISGADVVGVIPKGLSKEELRKVTMDIDRKMEMTMEERNGNKKL